MYLVDTFTVFAVSATGACSIIRSHCSSLIPLGANPLYDSLGYESDNCLLAFIVLGFVPISVLLMKSGEQIGTNPRFQPALRHGQQRIRLYAFIGVEESSGTRLSLAESHMSNGRELVRRVMKSLDTSSGLLIRSAIQRLCRWCREISCMSGTLSVQHTLYCRLEQSFEGNI